MPDFLYDNINLGSGAGAINAGITGTILANALSGWFAYPVVTNTDGVAGLFPAIITQ